MRLVHAEKGAFVGNSGDSAGFADRID